MIWGPSPYEGCLLTLFTTGIPELTEMKKMSTPTPYKIWRGKKPTIKYFKTFESECYILQDRKNLGKFDPKSDEGIFLGYSTNSRA